MPGNEVGDRIHNFFGQENLSQAQHHSQLADGSWPGLSNNLWVGNERQIGADLISNFKNYNIQPGDSERGFGGSSSGLQHGLSFPQSPFRPEFSRNQFQDQQLNLNGYMQGHQAFQTRHNEANFLGVDTESDQHNFTSRGLSVLDSQLGNGPELKQDSLRLEPNESPVNYDFLGGQQQMSAQHPDMLRPSPRQQSGVSDMQLMQQQLMFRQMQEFQRQQRIERSPFQQQEMRQLSSMSPLSSASKQSTSNQLPSLINGVPLHDSSGYSLQSDLMPGNMNWLQHGASPLIQGSPGGSMYSPEQIHKLQLIGMVPQQVDQSLFGVPVSTAKGITSQHLPQMDKPGMQHGTTNSFSFPSNQFTAFPDQVSTHDGGLFSRQGYEGQNVSDHIASPTLSSGLTLGNLHQVNTQQRNATEQEARGNAGPSDTSHGKVAMPAPAQTSATLDPTEERILFGSDDNLWDAFGDSLDPDSGGLNMSEGSDILGAPPSFQRGSWSALMQSAAAETSSGNAGVQDECMGLNAHSNRTPTRNQLPLIGNDGTKQQSVWADKNWQAASAPNSRPIPRSDDAKKSIENCNISGVQHLGSDTFLEQRQNNSSQGFVQKLPEEANKWLDCSSLQKPVADSKFYGNTSHSSDTGSWSGQQTVSLYNTDAQPSNGPNGWNFIESMSARNAALQHFQNNHKSTMQEETSNAKPATRSLPREDYSYYVGTTDSGILRGNQETFQPHPTGHNLNFWKNVNSVHPRDSGVPGNYQLQQDKRPQIESLGNSTSDKGSVEMHDAENSNIRASLSDSSRPNMSHHTSTSGRRENAQLDAREAYNFSSGNQKSTGQISQKPPATRKFQYHPMGDLNVDAEPSYGTKQAHPQPMGQQISQDLNGRDQEYSGQSKYLGHFTGNATESDKALLAGFQRDAKGPDGLPSKSFHPGAAPGTTTPFGGAVDGYASNKTVESSQNMLELLHKVDQFGSTTHVSSDHNQSSEMPETENSGGSVGHLQQNHSFSSRGFGLQLGPPSQRFPTPDRAINFQSGPHVGSEVGGKVQSRLPPASVKSLHPTHETSQPEFRNNITGSSGSVNKTLPDNVERNFSGVFPHSRSPLQNQHIGAGGQANSESLGRSNSQLRKLDNSHDRFQAGQSSLASVTDMSRGVVHQNQVSDSAHPFPVLEATPATLPSVTHGMSQHTTFSKMLPSAWSNTAAQLHSSGPQLHSSGPQLHSSGPQPSRSPSNLFMSHNIPGTQKLDDRVDQSGSFGTSSTDFQGYVGKEYPINEQQESPGQDAVDLAQSQGKESTKKQEADPSPSQPNATQKDIEAFGRSLRPNNVMNQNYSVQNQVQAMKNIETNPWNESLKRFKGPDSGLDTQQVTSSGVQQLSYGSDGMVRNLSTNYTAFSSADPRALAVSSKPGENHDAKASSHDMLALSRSDSQSNSSDITATVRGERSQISPQMAPSWFNQYGTFKNGQTLSTHDAWKIAPPKTMEQPLVITCKPLDTLDTLHSAEQVNAVAGPFGDTRLDSIPATISNERFSSPQLLKPDTIDHSSVVRPRKHKSASLELLPWHREVAHDLHRVQTFSAPVEEWAKMANLRIEKIENESEDCHPALKSKRRLIFTTQLMQQLLRPPPSAVLSADANAHYESVAYFVSRTVSGDACSVVSYPGNGTPVSAESGNLPHEKEKRSGRTGNQYLLKAAESLVGKAEKLENDFLRMEKASILDLRLESEDLERFSVINRFAKFHGRGQPETSSSSDPTANAQKFYPLRYVTALPIPRNVPDVVQCLSL